MKEIAFSKFKAKCIAVLQSVERTGQPLLVTWYGKPLAKIMPPSTPQSGGDRISSKERHVVILGDIISPIPDVWGDLGKK